MSTNTAEMPLGRVNGPRHSVGMGHPPHIDRLAWRLLRALVKEYGPDAPAALRELADRVERIVREIERDPGRRH
jgi:hypothetical protein